MIQIQPTGSYFNIDTDGYLINPASLDNIQPEYQAVIQDVINLYKEKYGDALKQVYLRGSVAKGQAIPYISDLDTFAYVDESAEYLKENSTNRKMRAHIEEKYDFVNNIEMSADPLSIIEEDYILLNQSVCIYGKPLVIPKMKPGKEMVSHAPNFHNRLVKYKKFLAEESDDEEMKKFCTWVMKGFLRTGFELTMERSKRYTRDLYLCYKDFSEYYPEKESEMHQVLHLALNPTTDKKIIQDVIDGINNWILSEIPKYFDVKR
ncbi:MAG: nucleotidyltransferase domain-containing protein [Candidatus Pacebacteria bacterium]|nr:nucleotidyltransferase domain-containing protein [Candidatus Paceibacterota bacterium]